MNDLTAQTIAGRYFVQNLLGRGGMAEVYKVWDEERSTWLAMKLLREDLAEDLVFLKRFRREAVTLQKLQHPNIVRFYGLEKDGPLAFILMDFIEGVTLRRLIHDRAGQGVSGQEVLGILTPMCSALSYAHRQGVVHCDVKPANIMIDQGGRVLVSDFGISRAAEGSTTVTMVGAGTPAYMAPEQVLGQPPTPQTDIYAQGIVLYEMVTGGERPFTGEHARTTGTAGEKVRWEQVNLDPPSPRKYRKDLSRELEQVIMTCLAKDPALRYVSSLDLLNAVQAGSGAAEAKPVVTPPEPVGMASAPAAAVPPVEPPAAASPKAMRQGVPIGVWAGGAIVVVALLLGGIVFGGGLGKSGATSTPMASIAVTDSNVQGLIETITTQARQLTAPTNTAAIPPTDTPTTSNVSTAIPIVQVSVTPKDTPVPTLQASTAIPPSLTPAPTITSTHGSTSSNPLCPPGSDVERCSTIGVSASCPAGMTDDCYCHRSTWACNAVFKNWHDQPSCIAKCQVFGPGVTAYFAPGIATCWCTLPGGSF